MVVWVLNLCDGNECSTFVFSKKNEAIAYSKNCTSYIKKEEVHYKYIYNKNKYDLKDLECTVRKESFFIENE